MIIKVNLLEIASELAHGKLKENRQITESVQEAHLYKNPNAKVLEYKDAVQDEFNKLYEYYFWFIEDLSEESIKTNIITSDPGDEVESIIKK